MGNLKKWLFLGLFFRILIMPFTGHWDLTSLHVVADSIYKHGPSFIYQGYYYAIYPPLTYFTLGLWQKFITLLVGGDLTNWVGRPVAIAFQEPYAFRYLFFLKLLYLPFDLLIGFILTKFVVDKEKKDLLFKSWMLNPIVIYVVYMWSSIDIIPTFFLLLAVYLFIRNRTYFSLLSLGLGSAFKLFPILFIPIFIVLGCKTNKDKLKGFLMGTLPLLITVLPWATRPGVLKNIFFSSSSNMLTNASIYIGGNIQLPIFLAIWTFILFYLNKNKIINPSRIINIVTLTLLLIYCLSAFTPQWFIWVMPFLLYHYLELPFIRLPLKILFALYAIIVLLFEITLNFGLLAPLEVSILNWPSLGDLVNNFFSVDKMQGLVRSLFGGIAIFIIYLINFYPHERKN